MANFVPSWYSTATSTKINEGETQQFNVFVKKREPTENRNSYNIETDQYIELCFSFKTVGATKTDSDIIVTAGDNAQMMENIELIDSTYSYKTGTYKVVLKTRNFTLPGNNSSRKLYTVNVKMVDDGVWDGEETLQFNIEYVHIVAKDTYGNITSIKDDGITDTTVKTMTYDASTEYWVTPSTEVFGNIKSSIGSISYGAESRLFIQAFGYSRPYDSVLDASKYPDDFSSRVFVPAYNLMQNTSAYIPTSHITGRGALLNALGTPTVEEAPIMIRDPNTNQDVKTGLTFLCNGQIVQSCLYDSDPIDAYLRAQVIDIRTLWGSFEDMMYEGKRFRAYQTWIAPDDISVFDSNEVKPGHMYMLKDTTVYPYVIKSIYNPDGSPKLSFEPDVWLDMGVYDASVGSALIGQSRVFRIVMNNQITDDIEFVTDSNLGDIHVGEYYGHTQYAKIVATGNELITYSTNSTGEATLAKYGLRLSADGTIIGTAYAGTGDFDANDHVVLNFTCTAVSRSGRELSKDFKITLLRGFGPNFMSAYVIPSKAIERKWFSIISTSTFSGAKLYRPSDERFGLQRLPRILVKENLVDSQVPYVSLKETKIALRNNIISATNAIPEGPFTLTLGNYKLRAALDNDGAVLYEVLYLEVLQSGYRIQPSIDPYDYTSDDTLVEMYGLRDNLVKAIGEDTYNLGLDPDDYKNRALVVPGVEGVSDDSTDTVPRHMVHPVTTKGAKPGFIFMVPVAYLEPGTGDLLYASLLQNNEHLSVLNTDFDVQAIEFVCYNSSTVPGSHVKDSFAINLIKRE